MAGAWHWAAMAAVFAGVTLPGIAGAEDVLAEASGNWAGPNGGGFWFRAELVQNGDKARLTIWNALDGVPQGGDPALDNPEFGLLAFASEAGPSLEVFDNDAGTGSILMVVTDFADEEGEGREVVQIQFIDNMFTVVSYYHASQLYVPDGPPEPYSCDVDLQA
jgi:hypothetical protein